jgi:pilus assembly protein Flp/PilA
MRNFFKRLLSEERGATAIEYGLIAGLIAVVIIGALTATGTSLNTLFGNV